MVCAELALLGCAFGVIGLTASSLTTHEGIADIASPSTDADTRRSEVCSELARTYRLTEREAVILEYLSMGYTMQRIAELQYISQNTVRSHTKGLYRKLDCHSKQEVIEMVSRKMKSQA